LFVNGLDVNKTLLVKVEVDYVKVVKVEPDY
jgi:hypothetical protein